MNRALFAALFLTGMALVALFVGRGVRRGGLARDAFPTLRRRNWAVGALVFVLMICVVAPFASGLAGRSPEPANLSPLSAFALHALFFAYLVLYYFLSGRPPILDFLKLRTPRPARDFLYGIPVAAFAWALSIAGMLGLELVLSLFAGPGAPKPSMSPVIPWIVAQPVAFRIGIVLSAMVFEEAFFRSFLQPRIGAVGATIFFTLAHGVYGQPTMLFGILILSIVLSVAFEVFHDVLPAMAAHGAFDAFEIFVLIPLALKVVGT
jgi:membrane protease YdiL (CAAX protease family)